MGKELFELKNLLAVVIIWHVSAGMIHIFQSNTF